MPALQQLGEIVHEVVEVGLAVVDEADHLTGEPVERSPLAPDVPTISEAGVAGYQASIWNGVLAPAATPRAIIARLNTE
ncbi:MAG: hypothetical protein HYY79_02715, partial [Betaproteobacteria bacterium]|nr:hypothetical protein [Betaproteobacteria bacterium]